MPSFIARVMEFKGEDLLDEGDYALEVTDVTKGGFVEITFDVTPKSERVYIKFQLHELVRLVMDQRPDTE